MNSFPHSADYVRQLIGSALVQIMSCRSFDAMPFPNQCCVIVTWTFRNKLQWNLNQNTRLSFTKMHLNISPAKWRPFWPGGVGGWVKRCNTEINYIEWTRRFLLRGNISTDWHFSIAKYKYNFHFPKTNSPYEGLLIYYRIYYGVLIVWSVLMLLLSLKQQFMKTPYMSPSWTSYEVSNVTIWDRKLRCYDSAVVYVRATVVFSLYGQFKYTQSTFKMHPLVFFFFNYDFS